MREVCILKNLNMIIKVTRLKQPFSIDTCTLDICFINALGIILNVYQIKRPIAM